MQNAAAPTLPDPVSRALTDLVQQAGQAFGDKLVSIVLFGSAAESRLRATSDVNVVLVLADFRQSDIESFAPALQQARAAIRLEPMFLLESEIDAAAHCFAQKFSDIERRRFVLFGPDPFANLAIPRSAEIFRLKQILLNLLLRLRESFALRAGREEQMAALVADTAGPLRASAATLLKLETGAVYPPKEALELIAHHSNNAMWNAAIGRISEAREQAAAATAPWSPVLFTVLEIAEHLRRRSGDLNDESV